MLHSRKRLLGIECLLNHPQVQLTSSLKNIEQTKFTEYWSDKRPTTKNLITLGFRFAYYLSAMHDNPSVFVFPEISGIDNETW